MDIDEIKPASTEEETPLEETVEEVEEGQATETHEAEEGDGSESPADEATEAEEAEGEEESDLPSRLAAENMYLRGRLAQVDAGQKPAPQQAAPVEEDDDIPDAEFEKMLAKDAVGAIKARDAKRDAKWERKLQAAIQNRIAGHQDAQDAHTQDYNAMVETYPEVNTDQVFRDRAERFYAILKGRWGKEPGLQLMAASLADSALKREAMKKNGNGKQTASPAAKLGATPVAKRTQNPGVKSSNNGGETPAKGDPLAGFNAKDRALAIKNCKALGVSLADFRKNYDQMVENDPSYGKSA